MDSELWNRAEKLFRDGADLPREARAAFVDANCGDDDALRELLQSLLDGDVDDADIREAVGSAAESLASSQTDRWLGTRIGAYTVEKRIAEGGMGLVFLACRTDERFEQRVAIKLLPARLASEELRRRFEAERQILARLRHPNIGLLFDGGETDEGIPYLVMEYIDGVPIDEYGRSHALSVDARIRLFCNVCAAVDYAHTNLVIHRDIKPSNILVSTDGVPKLLDFGIAKLIDANMSESAALTVDGSRLFTPRHASPEQVLGEPITTASDVYALGLLLYELLTDSFPYEITAQTSAGEMEGIITSDRPPRPSTRVDSVRSRQLRGDLDTILMKCLRKDPARRYQSAAGLSADLERYLGHRPILARPPTTAYLLSRFWRRNRIAATGVAATLTAIVVGAIATTAGFIEAREAERRATAEARNAEAISGFLVSLFQEAHPDTSAGKERSVRELLEFGRERVDDQLGDSPLVKANVLATLAGVYKGLSDYDEALDLQRQALTLAEEHAADDLVLIGTLRNDLGDLLRLAPRHAEAEAMIRSSIDAFEASGAGISDAWADAVNNLGLVLVEMDRREEGIACLQQTLSMREQLFDPPHEKIALSLHNLAWYYSRSTDLALAADYAERAIAMREAVFGGTHPRVAATVSLLSRIYQDLGRWNDAEREARRSLSIAQSIFDTGHPDVTFPMYELASVLKAKGNLSAANELFEEIVRWERVSLGEGSHDVGMSIKAWANTLSLLGRYAEAEPLLREALEIFEALPGGSRRGQQTAQLDLATLYIETGRLDEAASMLGADRELGDEHFDTDYAVTGRQIALARLELARNRPGRAQAALDGYFALDGTPADAALSGRPDLMLLQARVLRVAGEPAAAIALLRSAQTQVLNRWGSDHWQAAVVGAELGRAALDAGDLAAATAAVEAALPVLRASFGADHPETVRAEAVLAEIERATAL
ncbi:MAG: serine/threonine-protein kinase [Gammaproteobacteria bacterium]|nr:serine/threonine-protein kinase [Gammaproteobacteria bacterium]MDH4255532.1 serine/threonine-protein kinase [Gammaproteobacteria bacterium]MDH5311563.1 serine/threonine-protein kinase [Gammaproteobacteria bacterium]